MPWLKVTFDPAAPGAARVRINARSRRTKEAPGRWLVFDKNFGYTCHGRPSCVLYDAATFEECCKWIDERRERRDVIWADQTPTECCTRIDSNSPKIGDTK